MTNFLQQQIEALFELFYPKALDTNPEGEELSFKEKCFGLFMLAMVLVLFHAFMP